MTHKSASNLAHSNTSNHLRILRHPITHLSTQANVEGIWSIGEVNIGLKLRFEDGRKAHLSYSEIHKLER